MKVHFLLSLMLVSAAAPCFAGNLTDTPTAAISQSNPVTAENKVQTAQATQDFKNPVASAPVPAPLPVIDPLPKVQPPPTTDNWEDVPPFDPDSDLGRAFAYFEWLKTLIGDPKYAVQYDTYLDDDGEILSQRTTISEVLADGSLELVGGYELDAQGELIRVWSAEGPLLIGPNDV